MGGQQVKFQEEQLREFEELTPFNRAEISHAFVRFRDLYFAYHHQPQEQHNQLEETVDHSNNPHHIFDNHGLANPMASLPITYIMEELPELKSNPFKYRICRTFCVSNNGQMNFTEFLDMVSSFSPKADLEKKVHHAFQIFDTDEDGLLSRSDLYVMMDMMTGTNEILLTSSDRAEWERVKQWIVDGIFFDCNKRESIRTVAVSLPHATDNNNAEQNYETEQVDFSSQEEALTIEDFRYCVHRSPDFKNVFSFKI